MYLRKEIAPMDNAKDMISFKKRGASIFLKVNGDVGFYIRKRKAMWAEAVD
jgi:hypothetical protein